MGTEAEIIWVCGGVMHDGSVTGHAYRVGDDIKDGTHYACEKCGTTFRWSVRDQMFMDHFTPQNRPFTEDERVSVMDWLVKNGYANADIY